MSEYAILVGHRVRCCNLLTWARWFEATSKTPGEGGAPSARHVAYTALSDGHVSTVFLGVNCGGMDGGMDAPLWFESMVFIAGESVDMRRYATWAEAEQGHARMVHKHRVNWRANLEGHTK